MAKRKGSKKDYSAEIAIPAGIEVILEKNIIIMKKDGKELKLEIDPGINAKKNDGNISLEIKKAGKKIKKNYGTAKSHITNMAAGLDKGYEYELEICNVHFPITAVMDKAKGEILVKNMLGEKSPRIAKVLKNVDVEIKAPKIKIKSFDLEAAGQTAANLEKVTKIRNRDRNKFQDGIFITKKPGVEFI